MPAESCNSRTLANIAVTAAVLSGPSDIAVAARHTEATICAVPQQQAHKGKRVRPHERYLQCSAPERLTGPVRIRPVPEQRFKLLHGPGPGHHAQPVVRTAAPSVSRLRVNTQGQNRASPLCAGLLELQNLREAVLQRAHPAQLAGSIANVTGPRSAAHAPLSRLGRIRRLALDHLMLLLLLLLHLLLYAHHRLPPVLTSHALQRLCHAPLLLGLLQVLPVLLLQLLHLLGYLPRGRLLWSTCSIALSGPGTLH